MTDKQTEKDKPTERYRAKTQDNGAENLYEELCVCVCVCVYQSLGFLQAAKY